MAHNEQLPVEEARAGKSRAWDLLFRRYQLPLYTYVCELVNDEQTSLDIVQEVFISATRHLHQLREDARFGSWLFGIAHQKCLQHWRKKSIIQVSMEELDEDYSGPDTAPSEWLIRQEDEECFMRCLNQLPPPQRNVLLLHFLEGFSLEEIAEITGAGLGTVKSRMHYAKKALKELLEDVR